MTTGVLSPRSRALSSLLKYTVSIIVGLIVAIPLYICVIGGFKSLGQLQAQPMSFPVPPDISQYRDLITSAVGTFWDNFGNSVLVAALTVVLGIALCASAAFALARIRFRLSGLLYNYFLIGLLFPLAVAILPLYLQLRTFGLLNTYWGVVLPQIAFGVPFNIVLLRGFFKTIPAELEDATAIDGYGPLGFFYYMVLPLSTPILATAGILALVGSWNNFFLPLLVFNDANKFTLPMGVMNFMTQHGVAWNQILAFDTLAMIPAIILFILAQRYIVAGLTGGALKG